MKSPTALLAGLLLAANICWAENKTEMDIRRSVVHFLSTQHYPNLLKPWGGDTPSGSALRHQRSDPCPWATSVIPGPELPSPPPGRVQGRGEPTQSALLARCGRAALVSSSEP
jgi:hypothetical protein